MDYRDIPREPAGRFTKIVSLEMAEHVGIFHYAGFLRQVYNLLDDDGTFLLQVAGLRPSWQYEDLVWCVLRLFIASIVSTTEKNLRGLFMNKYVRQFVD